MTLTETKYNYKIKRHVLPFLPHPSPWEKKKNLLKILQHQKKRVFLTNTSRKPPKLKNNRQNHLLLLMEENVKPLK